MNINSKAMACAALITLVACGSPDPTKGDGSKRAKPGMTKADKKLPSIKAKTKGYKSESGMFTIHVKGEECLWELGPGDLSKEYFWSCVRTTGVGEKLMTGGMGPLRPVTFRRHANTLLVEQPITEYFADDDSAQSLGLEKNFKPSVIARLPLVAEKGDRILVDGSKLLRTFSFAATNGLQAPGEYSRVKDGTRLMKFRSYPKNFGADVEVDFAGKSPKSLKGTPVADSKYVTVGLHFDLVERVKSDYVPRKASEKVGYFTVSRRNLTDPESRRPDDILIRRWNLKKKNPDEAVSDVVQPITFWISNNTPYQYREIIREGVLEWNKAFEAAGLRNAVVCKIQPADADWDIGDFRYSVIQWMTSKNNFFLGHGPVKSDPYTGEILRAHIRLEGESFHSLGSIARMLEEAKPSGDGCHEKCNLSPLATEAAVLSDVVELASDGLFKKEEVIHQLIKKVAIHEVGHTLGLRHNFRSNLMTPADKIHDKAFVEANGLTGSIMDYVKTNLNPDPRKQGYFYSPTVGTYDVWAIRYGYTPSKGGDDEEKVLAGILANPLPYSTDEDAGEDPWAQRFVQGSDPIGYEVTYRKALVNAISTLKPGTPMSKIPGRQRKMFAYLTKRWYSAFGAMSRFIGGHTHDRAADGGKGRMSWVPADIENRALDEMLVPLSDDAHLTAWQKQWDSFPPTRAWSTKGKPDPLTYDFEGFVTGMHGGILRSILSVDVFNRLLEHELRGLEEGHLTQSSLLVRVTGTVNQRRAASHWGRRNFELLVDALIRLSSNKALNATGRHLVNAQLKVLRKELSVFTGSPTDVNTAVLEGVRDKIDAHFDAVRVKVQSGPAPKKKR